MRRERVSCNEGVWADGREGLLRVCGQTGERVFSNEGVWADGRVFCNEGV